MLEKPLSTALLVVQKGRLCISKIKRGKGIKLMAVANINGLPVTVCFTCASPHEVKQIEQTLDNI